MTVKSRSSLTNSKIKLFIRSRIIKKEKKMNFREICQIGVKILVTGAAIMAVALGISKLTEKKQPVSASNGSSDGSNGGNKPAFDNNPQRKDTLPVNHEVDNEMVNGLKKTQDMCGKLFAVFQSLIVVVESFNRIFSNQPSNSYYNQPQMYGQFNDPWGFPRQQYPIVQVDNNTVWTRLSPYIVAAGPNPNSNRNNYSGNYSI